MLGLLLSLSLSFFFISSCWSFQTFDTTPTASAHTRTPFPAVMMMTVADSGWKERGVTMRTGNTPGFISTIIIYYMEEYIHLALVTPANTDLYMYLFGKKRKVTVVVVVLGLPFFCLTERKSSRGIMFNIFWMDRKRVELVKCKLTGFSHRFRLIVCVPSS